MSSIKSCLEPVSGSPIRDCLLPGFHTCINTGPCKAGADGVSVSGAGCCPCICAVHPNGGCGASTLWHTDVSDPHTIKAHISFRALLVPTSSSLQPGMPHCVTAWDILVQTHAAMTRADAEPGRLQNSSNLQLCVKQLLCVQKKCPSRCSTGITRLDTALAKHRGTNAVMRRAVEEALTSHSSWHSRIIADDFFVWPCCCLKLPYSLARQALQSSCRKSVKIARQASRPLPAFV